MHIAVITGIGKVIAEHPDIDPKIVVPIRIERMHEEEWAVADSAASTIEEVPDGAAPFLIEALRTATGRDLRLRLIELLASKDERGVSIPLLQGTLDDLDPRIRPYSAEAIELIADPSEATRRVFRAAMESDDRELRMYAATWVDSDGLTDADLERIFAILDALGQRETRCDAALSIQSGGCGERSARAVPALARAAEDPEAGDEDIQACLGALGTIGPAAREALPAIERLRHHSSDFIREAAEQTRNKISGKE